jgi:hypothetical protein
MHREHGDRAPDVFSHLQPARRTIEDPDMPTGPSLLICGALTILAMAAAPAMADDGKITLFKVITVKDEIVIGMSPDDLKALGGGDASAVAHALAQKGDLTAWQYNVHRGPNGELQMAPTARIGLLANASLRVEPATSPYAVLPHP